MPNRLLETVLGTSRPVGPALAIIAVAVASAAGLFAYTAGWLTPSRLTPVRMVDALSRRGGDPFGHRRNHAKGVCFTGVFAANGTGTAYSKAPMLAVGRYPVVGRFAIAIADPTADDATGRVRSMAVRITSPDGQEWRSGMNNIPVFVVATPEDFYTLTVASEVSSKTGQPDPAASKRFFASHPESAPFLEWAKTAPWTGSYADQDYKSLNSFVFTNAAGERRVVRWTMKAKTAPTLVPLSELKTRGPDFLANDLRQRLGAGELRWELLATFADPGDPVNDSTKAWPEVRKTVDLGTLVVQKTEAEADGPCRDYNYDPLILPGGISGSGDPILAARSSAYARSFNLRTAEAGHYPRTVSPEAAR